VAAMIGGQRIVRLQSRGNAGGNGFLADGQMNEAWNFTVAEQRRKPLLDFADKPHAGVKPQELGWRRLCPGRHHRRSRK
jgi:hypothetical protein